MADDLEANKAVVRRLFEEGFNAGRLEVVDVAEGDRVASMVVMAGTNTGVYRRGGATGRKGEIRAFFVWRIADGYAAWWRKSGG